MEVAYRALAAMVGHPLIEQHAETAGLDWTVQMPPTLDAVLDELGAFGEVALTSAQESADIDPQMRHQCVVDAAIATTTLAARGPTRVLAALRCLMEALSDVERQSNHADAAWFHGELD